MSNSIFTNKRALLMGVIAGVAFSRRRKASSFCVARNTPNLATAP
jgi:hypothetical protein